jgi:hypothetical protein
VNFPCPICANPHFGGSCPKCGFSERGRTDSLLRWGANPNAASPTLIGSSVVVGHAFSTLSVNGTVPSGDWLLVCLGYDGIRDEECSGVSIGSSPLSLINQVSYYSSDYGGEYSLELWGCYLPSTVSGAIVATFPTPAFHSCGTMVAIHRSGINPSTPADAYSLNSGSGTTATSGATGDPTAPQVFVVGIVAIEGDLTDSPGAWQNGFSQRVRVGPATPSSSPRVMLVESYREIASGAQEATIVGITNRPWGAIVRTFRK